MGLADRHWKALRKKASPGKSGFPIATVAFYGPNNALANKVAVGIVLGPDQKVGALQRWRSTSIDIRKNELIAREVLEFLRREGVSKVVMMEKIMGCPHEEGIDYPDGESCPACPYWRNRDRFTHELLQ